MNSYWIAAFAVLFGCVAFVCLLVLGLLRRIIPVLEEAEARVVSVVPAGLSQGSVVPEFVALTVSGIPFDETELAREPTVLLFLSHGCPPCEALVRELGRSRPTFETRVIAVARDTQEDRSFLQHMPVTVILDDESVWNAFQTRATPHAFLVIDGVVARTAVPNSTADLHSLTSEAPKGGERSIQRAIVRG